MKNMTEMNEMMNSNHTVKRILRLYVFDLLDGC